MPALVPMIAERSSCPFTYATRACSSRHINGRDPGRGGERGEGERDERHRETTRDPCPAEPADDRVEEERDQAGDDEEEDGVTHRAGDRPRDEQDKRQADELDPARDNHLRRPSRLHGVDGTAAARRPKRPAWDWSFFEDGALALDRHERWAD